MKTFELHSSSYEDLMPTAPNQVFFFCFAWTFVHLNAFGATAAVSIDQVQIDQNARQIVWSSRNIDYAK